MHLLVFAVAVLRCDAILLLAPVRAWWRAPRHGLRAMTAPCGAQVGLHLLATRALSLRDAILHGLVRR